MAELVFEDLEFEEKGNVLRVSFLDRFYFEVDLVSLGNVRASGKKIVFDGLSEEDARQRFNGILDANFENLVCSTTKNRAVYVNRYSGIPLIGSNAFGIVDRNSNMIEIKPITGCNMNCIFCSVDEGLSSRKRLELVIDREYLVEEARKLIEFKNCEVHLVINAHGEPTLYKPMPELIRDLSGIRNVKTTSLITNGTLLTESYIDRLAEAGLTRLNLSLNAISGKAAKILEGHGKYDVEYVKKMAEYAAKKLEVVLAPVYVPGHNDEELGLIVEFAKKIGAKVGIQNYLYYRKGRNPANVSESPWEKFYAMLRNLEKKHDFTLIMDEKDFGVFRTEPLPKPFKTGNVIEAVVKSPGRYKNEALAAAGDRSVTITHDATPNKKLKLKITGDKHNIFFGKEV